MDKTVEQEKPIMDRTKDVPEVVEAKAEPWEADEYLKSPTYKHPIPFFTSALNGQEIVPALECRMYGLSASETFVAVHWSVLREARDEVDTLTAEIADLRAQLDEAMEAGKRLIKDFRWRADQCRSNPDAYCPKAASVWDLAAEALEAEYAS